MASTSARLSLMIFLVLSSSAFARAQEPDLQFRADIDRLMAVTGVANIGSQMVSLLSERAIDGLKTANPSIPAPAFSVVKDVLDSELSKAFVAPKGLREQMVDIYARHFTHDEVRTLLRFYNTPVGQKTIALMPTLMRESGDAGEDWAALTMGRISGIIQERLREEGYVR